MIDREALRSLLVEAAAAGAEIALSRQRSKSPQRAEQGLERLLSLEEAGRALHVTTRTMRAWCASGRVRSRLVGRRRLIAEADVRVLLERDQDALLEADARRMVAEERRDRRSRAS
jgi:excisionase family DNA binding protein